MITASFPGSDRLVERLVALPASLRAALLETVTRLTIELQRYVMKEKLTGQVLHNRTGTLRRSIYQHVNATADAVLGEVGTNLSYGVMWETTGMAAHDVVPVKAKALSFVWNGERVFFKRVHIPAQGPRSFLKSALADKEDYIRAEILKAVRAAVRGTLYQELG
jgi:phage gpG-like protein